MKPTSSNILAAMKLRGILCIAWLLAASGACLSGPAYASTLSTSPSRTGHNPLAVKSQGIQPAISSTSYATIAFDEVPLESFVTNEYEADGVVFTSTVQTSQDASNATSPVLSGYPRFEGAIEGYFVDPATGNPQTVASFTLDVGYINNRDSVVVDAFDASGNLIQTAVANSFGINTLTLTYQGIASFSVHEVSEEEAGFAIDNLSVDPVGGPTPISSVASFGDSYSSGEGLLPGLGTEYDCGTDMPGDTYFENTTLPYLTTPGYHAWDSQQCDTTNMSNQEPDLLSRAPTFYDNGCHRHNLAYPVQIARIVKASQSIFVACSGATTANIGAISQTAKPQHPHSPLNVAGGNTQLTDVENFRRDRLGGNDPSLITIGIGGNDAGFSSIAKHCIVTILPCSSDSNFVDTVINNITGPVYEKLEETFTSLRDTFPNSTIVAFGYPSPVSGAEPDCNGDPLYQQDKEFLGGAVLDTLNEMISEAAGSAGISYVDISSVTVGHEICTAEPWFRGLSYPVVQSFHPTQFAHNAIARYFRDHYTDGNGNLLVHNPAVPSNPIQVVPTGTTGNIADLQGGAGTPCGAGCVQSTPCIQSCSVTIQGSGYAPQASLEAVLHSTPYDLGPVTADENGEVNATVTIPAGVEPGEHVITLDGSAPDGSPQYGALGLDILSASGAPVGPLPNAPLASAPGNQGTLGFAHARPARALVILKRRKRHLTVRVGCPRTATSACTITLVLRRAHKIHRRTRITVLGSHTIRLAAGQMRTVSFTSALLLSARRQIQLIVTTSTSAGRITQALAISSQRASGSR
jgi:hypothetical protein